MINDDLLQEPPGDSNEKPPTRWPNHFGLTLLTTMAETMPTTTDSSNLEEERLFLVLLSYLPHSTVGQQKCEKDLFAGLLALMSDTSEEKKK